jgi:hypothetical protein
MIDPTPSLAQIVAWASYVTARLDAQPGNRTVELWALTEYQKILITLLDNTTDNPNPANFICLN